MLLNGKLAGAISTSNLKVVTRVGDIGGLKGGGRRKFLLLLEQKLLSREK